MTIPRPAFIELTAAMSEPRRTLVEHRVYGEVRSLPQLREFMGVHVFAVWDFMSLIKRLQQLLTTTVLPWTPAANPRIARFVNEIVLDEESDVGPDGQACSHFELYVRAMEEVGSDTAPICRFIDVLEAGGDPHVALAAANAPTCVREFVSETLRVATQGSPLEVAACFLFGREDVIPDMFAAIRNGWPEASTVAPCFVHYLERHIELDGEQHSVLAREMLDELSMSAGVAERDAAERAALRAIELRTRLWDDLLVRTSTVEALAPSR